MATAHILVGDGDQSKAPVICHITVADIVDALRLGLDDFAAMPSHAVFLCVIYPLLGLLMVSITLGDAMMPLAFPLVAGFALIGPLAAIGLYELSRRREAGLDTALTHAFEVFRSRSLGSIVALSVVLMAIFLVWLAVAEAIYVANFGYHEPASILQFVKDVMGTAAGWHMIVEGIGIGFLFAVVALTISAVSFPLLLDRDVGAAVAVLTSVRAVAANPFTMALWGIIVAALLVIGSLPLFLGLTVVMPLLGHATWHLYRKVVEPDSQSHAASQPRARSHRSAADFPAALFPSR